eukprot:scaffold639_cov304-Pinguiococcus_pyrenoidosus.AAC.6
MWAAKSKHRSSDATLLAGHPSINLTCGCGGSLCMAGIAGDRRCLGFDTNQRRSTWFADASTTARLGTNEVQLQLERFLPWRVLSLSPAAADQLQGSISQMRPPLDTLSRQDAPRRNPLSARGRLRPALGVSKVQRCTRSRGGRGRDHWRHLVSRAEETDVKGLAHVSPVDEVDGQPDLEADLELVGLEGRTREEAREDHVDGNDHVARDVAGRHLNVLHLRGLRLLLAIGLDGLVADQLQVHALDGHLALRDAHLAGERHVQRALQLVQLAKHVEARDAHAHRGRVRSAQALRSHAEAERSALGHGRRKRLHDELHLMRQRAQERAALDAHADQVRDHHAHAVVRLAQHLALHRLQRESKGQRGGAHGHAAGAGALDVFRQKHLRLHRAGAKDALGRRW